jgi:hypothetical protein
VNYLTQTSRNFEKVRRVLKDHHWDVVVNWIAYKPEDIERDMELFEGMTGQYIFISSASAYQKPPVSPVITESNPNEKTHTGIFS